MTLHFQFPDCVGVSALGKMFHTPRTDIADVRVGNCQCKYMLRCKLESHLRCQRQKRSLHTRVPVSLIIADIVSPYITVEVETYCATYLGCVYDCFSKPHIQCPVNKDNQFHCTFAFQSMKACSFVRDFGASLHRSQFPE